MLHGMFCKDVANVGVAGRGRKLIFVSLISYMVPSEKPSCSKVSPDVNLLIAWFPSTPLIHWSNLSSDLNKGKKKVFTHLQ